MVSAITFPRALPDIFLYCDGFDMDTDIQPSATRGGEGLIVENGRPLWVAKYRTLVLFGDEFYAMLSFIDSIKTPPNPVYAWDTRRRYSLNYPSGWTGLTRAGGGAFDGTCTLSAIDSDGKRLTLSGLPAGFVIKPGDFLSFPWDGSSGKYRRAYHRVASSPVTADGFGVVQIEVRPATSGSYSTNVTVTLDKPSFIGFLVPGSEKTPEDNATSGTFSFTIKQDLRRF